jgi:hypothetical protein
VRRRTSFLNRTGYLSIIELKETDMTNIGDKIFGVIIGSAIFFGVGVALAYAGTAVG